MEIPIGIHRYDKKAFQAAHGQHAHRRAWATRGDTIKELERLWSLPKVIKESKKAWTAYDRQRVRRIQAFDYCESTRERLAARGHRERFENARQQRARALRETLEKACATSV